jgi:hypothetical protein
MNTVNDIRGTRAQDWTHRALDASGSRRRSAQLAEELSLATLQQAEKALGGILAVPAALALGAATGLMFVAAVVEGGFEIVGGGVAEVGRRIGDARTPELHDPRERGQA